jgi:predicted acylesterase/phospholipase RssA
MKKIVLPLTVLISLTILFVILRKKDHNIQETVFQKPRKGVAVLITGAGARIPQEAALLEELDKRGFLKDLVFISGVSSGALNSVMLNGILSKRTTWNDYKKILFHLRNRDVFFQEGKKVPLNTTPARELFKSIVEEKLGYFKIGDLPYTTGISFTHPEDVYVKKNVYRMCSRKINEETDTTLSLVDIMMASSAIPVVFPPVRIRNVRTIPDVDYVDGGVGDDYIPFHALLEFEKFRGVGIEKVYIISRKSNSMTDTSEELKVLGINDKGLLDKLGVSVDAILKKKIIKSLEEYATESPELVPLTYVWIPDLNRDFLLLDFENLEEQYLLTSQWAKTHPPVGLGDFLLPFLLKEN